MELGIDAHFHAVKTLIKNNSDKWTLKEWLEIKDLVEAKTKNAQKHQLNGYICLNETVKESFILHAKKQPTRSELARAMSEFKQQHAHVTNASFLVGRHKTYVPNSCVVVINRFVYNWIKNREKSNTN